MVRIGRILRDYTDAGSVNALLAIWGFVDDDVFLTKAGHVGVVYRVRGIDYEGLTHGQRLVLTHRVQAALRLLDERCRLYQYFIKQTIDPIMPASRVRGVAREAIDQRAKYLNSRHDLYDHTIYFVLIYEPATAGTDRTGLR